MTEIATDLQKSELGIPCALLGLLNEFPAGHFRLIG